jgi:DNA-binding Lrp family transcriptional regulator
VVAPDPVDIRLLSLVAESGRAAVHDIAARIGMDPREVAARLTALSATGLPLIVGVECDPNGLRAAIAGAGPWLNYAAQGGSSGPHRTQTGPYPQQAPPMPPPGYPPPMPAAPSGPYPAPAVPSGPYPAPGGPSGPHSVPAGPPRQGPPGADPVSTWGPPQSSSWARGDQPARAATWTPPPAPQQGRVGETLRGDADGEQVTIQLVEVVDPADFLFTAAGYRLRPGERAVVVHTELTNRGSVPLGTLPDLYLVLVAKDGQTVGKAPVSLSSRPPHRMGLRPGETAGGHTVYVLPENTEITSVRWSSRPDDDQHALTWAVQP